MESLSILRPMAHVCPARQVAPSTARPPPHPTLNPQSSHHWTYSGRRGVHIGSNSKGLSVARVRLSAHHGHRRGRAEVSGGCHCGNVAREQDVGTGAVGPGAARADVGHDRYFGVKDCRYNVAHGLDEPARCIHTNDDEAGVFLFGGLFNTGDDVLRRSNTQGALKFEFYGCSRDCACVADAQTSASIIAISLRSRKRANIGLAGSFILQS